LLSSRFKHYNEIDVVYVCPYCRNKDPFIADKFFGLTAHVKRIHVKNNDCKCPVCGATFRSPLGLHRHFEAMNDADHLTAKFFYGLNQHRNSRLKQMLRTIAYSNTKTYVRRWITLKCPNCNIVTFFMRIKRLIYRCKKCGYTIEIPLSEVKVI